MIQRESLRAPSLSGANTSTVHTRLEEFDELDEAVKNWGNSAGQPACTLRDSYKNGASATARLAAPS